MARFVRPRPVSALYVFDFMINHYWTERPKRRAMAAALLAVWLMSSPAAFADVTLNFANADIEQIARAIGAATNQTIVVDPRVKGQLNLQSDRPVSNAEALKTLQAALRMQGFALLSDHGILKVVPEADAKVQGVPTYIGNRPQAQGDQVITQVFQLHNESATTLLPVIRPLITPNNTVAAYPSNNTIVVTDYADNVRRIASIIAGVDTVAGSDIEVLQLHNANAQDVAAEAQKLLDPSTIGSTDASLKVNVTTDNRINAVILRASNSVRMTMAKSLIQKLDARTTEPGNMHVVALRNADATEMAKTLRGMMGQSSGSGGSRASALGGASDSQASSGLSNSNGSLPPLPTGTTGSSGSGSTMGSSSSSSSYGLGGGSGSSDRGGDAASSDDSQGSGMIVADAATNSLIITASEPVYRNLRNVISQLDQRRAQIYIESLIMEVTSTKAGSFGVQWQGGVSSSNGNNAIVGNSNFDTSTSNGIFNLTAAGLAATSTGTTATGLSSVASTTLQNGLNIGLLHRFGSILGLGGLLQAVSTNSDVNVLSTPNLVTLDNQEARIMVGANIPIEQGSYSTGTTSTTSLVAYNTYDRKDVGILLNVRPQISQGGSIKLQIYQEDSNAVAATATQNGGYTINKRSVQSTVLADNGEIVVLGGLMQDEYDNANSKIPWLGNIPVIGALFRSESKSRAKTDLMIFLRPVIIRDSDTLRDISLNRYDYMRAESANYKTDNRVIKDKDIPVPPPADSGTGPGQVNGLFDWSRRERNVSAPPLSPSVQTQPPYAPDDAPVGVTDKHPRVTAPGVNTVPVAPAAPLAAPLVPPPAVDNGAQ